MTFSSKLNEICAASSRRFRDHLYFGTEIHGGDPSVPVH